ncbi:MAG: hypothetical protein AAF229_02640 [Pseudomonadota bacterium]
MRRRSLALFVAAALAGCASPHDDLARDGDLYELLSEQYIRGPGDTIGSDGPRAMGTTVCTYFNRDTNARVVRRFPGGLPCPPVL